MGERCPHIEDPSIRDIALRGAIDTTTRKQTICQVKVISPLILNPTPGTTNSDADPEAAFRAFDNLKGTGNRSLTVDYIPPEIGINTSLGYSGINNRLYRVELHRPLASDHIVYKWSKDNGSVTSAIIQDNQ